MHISIFEYKIQGIDDEGWSAACDELAPAFAEVPGLLSKTWLHGVGDIRGGVYLWADKESYEDFLGSDLGQAVGSHPNIGDLTVREFGVDAAPSAVTRGVPTLSASS